MAMEGTTLKNWTLGKKLGSGACSDVYAVEPNSSLNDKRCDAFVMKLSPLVDIPAAKSKNKKRKKSAAERNADALYAEHLMYQSHLRECPGLPYIPFGAYGEDKGYRFLVMERLGRTLEAVVRENGPVPSSTAAQLGYNILETLEYIHSKNIVYVDVKPENFMLNIGRESQVYCVDFGIADRYVMATGKHKDYKVGGVVGTPTFLSLNCHAGATASRRDDVEALLNVLLYLIRGNLPWQKATSDAEGAKIKKETSIATLCASFPKEWALMMEKARACEFEDKPDYEFFSQSFVKLGARPGSKEPFQWGKKGTKTATVAASESTASPLKKSRQDAAKAPVTQEEKPKAATAKAPAVEEKKPKAAKAKPAGKATRVNARISRAARKASTDEDEDSGEEEQDEEEEEEEEDDSSDAEVVGKPKKPSSATKDPQRRRKAAARAVAAAAAAEAAAKQAEGTRYNLRSKPSDD
ncbi:hypothetical protein Poli38472_009749 [Pythium oligandrum]|uniref:Casein kinase I n=1 Tax=Pythium oligandrum TaxID=41045 RepID=A0A8K1CF27_PYTOL|nr:hypothetical protein Poli38472_009749 [Pythium oligandrum]|eukprot:TMW62256.1 hypothetical protein Poli38472_009749 [Pythium oligandrum]